MWCTLLLLILQDPTPDPFQESAPNPPPEDTVSLDELEAKLKEVTDSFSEADLLLNRTVERMEQDLDNSSTESSAQQDLLLKATSTSMRLVAEMEELLELLPSPPPGQGSGQGNMPQDGNSGGENPSEQENGQEQGNKPAKGKPHPSHQEGEQGGMSPQDSALRNFLRDPRDGQWGKLPPRLQQAIDNASAQEVPLRYRRWLVEYHRQGKDANE